MARELQKALEYAKWENFKKVIDQAMLASKNTGFEIFEHFVEANKMVEMSSKQPKNQENFGFPEVRKSIITSINRKTNYT